jgi:hypothetical protein
MFDTLEFRQMLEKTLDSAVSSSALLGYDKVIIDELQKIAINVARKTSADIEASADTTPKEVRSAKLIAEQAAALAKSSGRNYITWVEVENVIELNFCSIFPFCTPKES